MIELPSPEAMAALPLEELETMHEALVNSNKERLQSCARMGGQLDSMSLLDMKLDLLLGVVFPTPVDRTRFEIAFQIKLDSIVDEMMQALRAPVLLQADGRPTAPAPLKRT